jgi:urea-proton symporter
LIILIPIPLFFAQTVYSTGGFTAWVIVSIVWTFLSAATVVLYPLYESRIELGKIFVGIVKVSPRLDSDSYFALFSFLIV